MNKSDKLSSLALANIEALAQAELPEFTLSCHQSAPAKRANKCWKIKDGLVFFEYPENPCVWTGNMNNSCHYIY